MLRQQRQTRLEHDPEKLIAVIKRTELNLCVTEEDIMTLMTKAEINRAAAKNLLKKNGGQVSGVDGLTLGYFLEQSNEASELAAEKMYQKRGMRKTTKMVNKTLSDRAVVENVTSQLSLGNEILKIKSGTYTNDELMATMEDNFETLADFAGGELRGALDGVIGSVDNIESRLDHGVQTLPPGQSEMLGGILQELGREEDNMGLMSCITAGTPHTSISLPSVPTTPIRPVPKKRTKKKKENKK